MTVEVVDVARMIARSARARAGPRFDAIVLDLYRGPNPRAADDPFYGRRALERTRSALEPDGVLAVWSEGADAGFGKRLAAGGFAVERSRPVSGVRRHWVYIARPRSDDRPRVGTCEPHVSR